MENVYHVTWVTHCSRVSARMFEYKVEKKEGIRLDLESEVYISKCIAEIIQNDKIVCHAYNICGDHVHMIIECRAEELEGIVRKLKSNSAREYNVWQGKTVLSGVGIPSNGASPTVGDVRPVSHAFNNEAYSAVELNRDESNGASPTVGEVSPDSHTSNSGACSVALLTPEPISRTPNSGACSVVVPKRYEGRGEVQNHLWARKFDRVLIDNETQLANAINYVRNNRIKHNLPRNVEVEKLSEMLYK